MVLHRSCTGKTTIQIDHTSTIKILVLGDKGVGKSSLILKYAKDDFDIHETPTVSVLPLLYRAGNINIVM